MLRAAFSLLRREVEHHLSLNVARQGQRRALTIRDGRVHRLELCVDDIRARGGGVVTRGDQL